jgi:regulation of enolase protein 1 (concanavalin A-like superfamily)
MNKLNFTKKNDNFMFVYQRNEIIVADTWKKSFYVGFVKEKGHIYPRNDCRIEAFLSNCAMTASFSSSAFKLR